jgi:hypothetical protein
MRSHLIIFTIICSAFAPSFGQYIMHTPNDLEQYMKTSENYQLKIDEKNVVKGSPYLTEEFKNSTLHLNKIWYEDIDLRYDIHYDCFEVKFKTGIQVIDPVKNNMDTVKYNGEVFVRKVQESGKNIKVAYMTLVEDSNSYSLYKQYKINVNSATTPTGYSEAKPAEFKRTLPWYYISNSEKLMAVKGLKSIAEVFNTDTKSVKNYLKKNKYKLSNENDLREVVLFFSSN